MAARRSGALYDAYGKTIAFLALTCVALVIYVAWMAQSAADLLHEKRLADEMAPLLTAERHSTLSNM